MVERGAHRDRVGVVAVVDQEDLPSQLDALPAEAGEHYPRGQRRHLRQVDPERDADRDRAERVRQVVGLGEGEAEVRLAARGPDLGRGPLPVGVCG